MNNPNVPAASRQVLAGEEPPARSAQIEYIVSLVLRYGVLLSFAVVAIGALLLFTTESADAVVRLAGQPIPHNPSEVLTGVLQLQPKSIIDFGLMLLIATPVIRVAVSVFAFFAEKDYTYTVVTIFVLAVLLTSFFLGRVE